MEWYRSVSKLGMFFLEGEGTFTGEEDIITGRQFAETLLNEGFHVAVAYGHTEEGEAAMKIKFTTLPAGTIAMDAH